MKYTFKFCYSFILLCMLLGEIAIAKDLGKRGNVFEIKEESFIAMMKRKLESVDIEKHQQKMENIAKDRVNNPTPVSGIKKATEGRVFYFDPTYELKEDAILPCGKVLHRAGTRVNPLEYMDLERRLFFIDSRDTTQVKWLLEQLDNGPTSENAANATAAETAPVIEDRVILVGGSVLQLKEEIREEHKDKIYFDQNGEIVGRFGIQHVPAIAQQEAMRIRIEEVKIDDEAGV